MRHFGPGRKSQRRGPGRRQSVRGGAVAALSDAADEAGLRPHAVCAGCERTWLQAVPAAVRQSVADLYQSARRHARAMHLLRLLRMVRLRQLFEGYASDHCTSSAAAQVEFRGAHRMRGDADQSRQHRKARHRRHLCGHVRRRIRAAGGHGIAVRLLAVQRATLVAVRHRQGLRPHHRARPDRAQFHPSDDVVGDRLLRQGQI